MSGAFGLSVGTTTYSLLLGAMAVHLSCKLVTRWRKLHHAAILRITADELKGKLDAGEDLVVLDLRHPLDRLASPYGVPGAVWLSPDRLHANAPAELRNRLVVFYCTGTNGATIFRMARLLRQRGIARLRCLAGGVEAWKDSKLPVEYLNDVSIPRSTRRATAEAAVRWACAPLPRARQ